MATFTHALATNNYGEAKFIVSANVYEGTHTTIASAITSASSGDTIFIRSGTYTENLSVTKNLSFVSWDGNQTIPTVTIIGKMTVNSSTSVTLSGIRVQTNSDNFLSLTNAGSDVQYRSCYLNCTNNTGISATNGGFTCVDCYCNLGTTGIKLYDISTSSGGAQFINCTLANSGNSTTASTNSSGAVYFRYCEVNIPLSHSGSTSIKSKATIFYTFTINTVCIVHNGNGGSNYHFESSFTSGTAVCMTVSQPVEVYNCSFYSDNTNIIDGASTLSFSGLETDPSGSNTISTSTQTPGTTRFGISRSTHQPCFLVRGGTAANVTGDGTVYTLTWPTETFDQNNNFASNTFTAPVTGRYLFILSVPMQGLTTSHTNSQLRFTTTAETFITDELNLQAIKNDVNSSCLNAQIICPMSVGDTCTTQLYVPNGTKVVDVTTTMWWSGTLVC